MRRRTLLGAAAAAPLALLPADRATAATPGWARATTPGSAGLVALTFDDGPSAEITPTVLSTLRRYQAKATFFLQGEHAAARPDLVRAIAADGHVIGNHSWSHPQFSSLTAEQARTEIVRTNDTIEQITGTRPVLFRYPFGEETADGNAVIREQGMWGGVLWHWTNPLPGDFECPGAAGVQKYVVGNAVDQALILLHDGNDVVRCGTGQLSYLGRTITELRRRGFALGVVDIAWGPSRVNQQSWVQVVPA